MRQYRRRVVITVSHMNRIVSSLLHHNPEKIDHFLTTTGKANFVLPTGCIIIGTICDGVMHFTMLPCAPKEIGRYVSSEEFNEIGLTLPRSLDYKEGGVYAFLRHGQGKHNLSQQQLDELWVKMSQEERDVFTASAIDRNCRMHRTPRVKIPQERRRLLAIREMRYDAPLTAMGRKEADDAAKQLRTFLQDTYPYASVKMCASELYRTYEMAALILKEWLEEDCTFFFESVVHASFRILTELHREIASATHELGTDGRRVAESLGLQWEVYAQHILKTCLTMEKIRSMTDEERVQVEDKVVHVTSENTPMPIAERPTKLHGVTVSHVISEVKYPDGLDLFSNLSALLG